MLKSELEPRELLILFKFGLFFPFIFLNETPFFFFIFEFLYKLQFLFRRRGKSLILVNGV